MPFSSLPRYPTAPQRASADWAEKCSRELSDRMARVLRDVSLLLAIVLLLVLLRWVVMETRKVPVPPRQPLDFTIVKERYPQFGLMAGRKQVEELLGPATNRVFPEADLQEALERAEHSHRHLGIPRDRLWQIWSDPSDEGVWIAVLYANDAVYWKAKKGF